MKKHHQTSRQDLKNSIKVDRTRRHGGGRPSVEDERGGGMEGCGLEDSHG